MCKFLYLILLLTNIGQKGFGQSANSGSSSCNCTVMLDPEYKGSIELYDSPNGRPTQSVRHNTKDEDYVVLTILGKQQGFFKVTMSYAQAGRFTDGWIKPGSPIGVFSRDYKGKGLRIYSTPAKSGKPVYTIKGYATIFFRLTDCAAEGWAKVRFKHNGSFHEGWMAREDQCDNPYTTCN